MQHLSGQSSRGKPDLGEPAGRFQCASVIIEQHLVPGCCPLVSRAVSLMRPRGGRTVGYWANGTIQGAAATRPESFPGMRPEKDNGTTYSTAETVKPFEKRHHFLISRHPSKGECQVAYETRTQRPWGWGLLSVPGSPAGKEYPTGCRRVGALCKTHIHPIHTRAQLTGLP